MFGVVPRGEFKTPSAPCLFSPTDESRCTVSKCRLMHLLNIGLNWWPENSHLHGWSIASFYLSCYCHVNHLAASKRSLSLAWSLQLTHTQRVNMYIGEWEWKRGDITGGMGGWRWIGEGWGSINMTSTSQTLNLSPSTTTIAIFYRHLITLAAV